MKMFKRDLVYNWLAENLDTSSGKEIEKLVRRCMLETGASLDLVWLMVEHWITETAIEMRSALAEIHGKKKENTK